MTTLGEVRVRRIAYRAGIKGVPALFPRDAVLNLPPRCYSWRLQYLVVRFVQAGAYEQAHDLLLAATGVSVGKLQLEQIAAEAAQDVARFYPAIADQQPGPGPGQADQAPGQAGQDLVVLPADGKGVAMRPESRRRRTKAPGKRVRTFQKRRGTGEKGHKRMAETGCVYDVKPVATRLGPGQHVHFYWYRDLGPILHSRSDQHVPGAGREHVGYVLWVGGVVEDQQPPVPLPQLGQYRIPRGLDSRPLPRTAQPVGQRRDLIANQPRRFGVDPPHQVIGAREPVRVLDRQLRLADPALAVQSLHDRPVLGQQRLPHRNQKPVPASEPRVAGRDIPHPRPASRPPRPRPARPARGPRVCRPAIWPGRPGHRAQQGLTRRLLTDPEHVRRDQRP